MKANGTDRINPGDTVQCPMWALVITDDDHTERVDVMWREKPAGLAAGIAAGYGKNWRLVPVLADVQIGEYVPPPTGRAGRGEAA